MHLNEKQNYINYIKVLQFILKIIIEFVITTELSLNIQCLLITDFIDKINNNDCNDGNDGNNGNCNNVNHNEYFKPKIFKLFNKINLDTIKNIKPSTRILLILKLLSKLSINNIDFNNEDLIKFIYSINEKTNKFVIVNTCPGAGKCQIYCYARKGGYVQWKSSSLSQTKIVNFLLNDPEGFKNKLIAEIRKEKTAKEKRGISVAIRWHDAGDFFSDPYLQLAYDVAKTFPDVQFYAYTKMASVAASDKPNNFIINFSGGADPAQESQVDFSTIKHSKVVDESLFSDLIYRDDENKIQYIPDKLNDLKKRIADHYKISKKTILTYDEWKAKKKPTRMALSTIDDPIKPGPWNVIVKPGDGDESANSLSVIGTYLLMH